MHVIAFIAVCAQLAGGATPAWSDVLDALHAGRDGEARVEHDPDPIIATYAAARLRAVRQRPWRRALRAASVGVVAMAALALAVRVGATRRRWRRQLGPFGRALLVAEVVALAGALIVPRWVNPLASSGWMASAIPSSIGLALFWATRAPSPSRRRAAVAVTLAAVACAAGLYLALDLTWWSVTDPMP